MLTSDSADGAGRAAAAGKGAVAGTVRQAVSGNLPGSGLGEPLGGGQAGRPDAPRIAGAYKGPHVVI